MNLTWNRAETLVAKTEDGTVYTVSDNFLDPKGPKYVAVRSVLLNGQLWEHLIGFFPIHYEACKACQLDAKS